MGGCSRGCAGPANSIDAMDLLIGTAAVIDGAPLITRNTRHFSKLPGLQVVEY